MQLIHHHARAPRATRAAGASAALAVLLLVSGCGADDSEPGPGHSSTEAAPVALTADQISQAVLQDSNMGEGWTSSPATDDDSEKPGCLGEVDSLTNALEKKARGGNDFTYDSASGFPYVESTVASYADEGEIATSFDQVEAILADCTDVVDTLADGSSWDLAMSLDDTAAFGDVDGQFSLAASGTVTQPGSGATEVFIEWTAVRIGPDVATVTTLDTQQRTTEHAAWAQIAVARLQAVIAGDQPAETTAPAPVSA